MEDIKKKIIKVKENKRLDICVKDNSNLSRGKVQKLIDNNQVSVNGKIIKSYHIQHETS